MYSNIYYYKLTYLQTFNFNLIISRLSLGVVYITELSENVQVYQVPEENFMHILQSHLTA